MNRRNIRRVCEHLYMLAVCALLLWNVAYMTEAPWTFAARRVLPLVGAMAAVAAILVQDSRRRVLLPVLLLAWMALRSVLAGVQEAQMPALQNGVTAFLAILPAPLAVEKKRLTAWMRGLIALWTAALTMQAMIGLWAALTGHAVFSLRGTWYIGVNLGDNRLYLMAYVTTGAVKMGLSIVMAAVGAGMARRGITRIAYVLCMAVMALCLALTDCRTAFIAVGASLGLLAAMGCLHGGALAGKRALRWLLAGAAVMALTVGTYAALSGTMTALSPHVPRELHNITLTELPGELLPSASAEAAGTAAVRHRALDAGNLFNDRQLVWRAAFDLLKAEPRLLLTGVTGVRLAEQVNLYAGQTAGRSFYHVHNIFLQVLVAWGLPGLLLLAACAGVFLRAAWKVMLTGVRPFWTRMVPVPTLLVLICEMVDCFTLLSAGSPMLLFGCLFAGWTLRLAEERAA